METKKITDAIMGDLLWSDESNEWVGNVDLGSVEAQFTLESNEKEEVSDQSRKTFNFLKSNELQVRETIAQKMLTLHNETWNPETPVSKEEFIKKIKLEGISFAEDGKAELFYEDGDLFWGHSITTVIDSNGEISEPSLAG